MNKVLYTLILCLLLSNFALIKAAQFCFSEEEINNIDSKKAVKIFSLLENATEEVRYKYLECDYDHSIYKLAENILKSEKLSDVQKLEYYYKVLLLYPNAAELGSVLGYDTIKLFIKYKRQPIKQTVDDIKDSKFREYIRKSLIDADLIEE